MRMGGRRPTACGGEGGRGVGERGGTEMGFEGVGVEWGGGGGCT